MRPATGRFGRPHSSSNHRGTSQDHRAGCSYLRRSSWRRTGCRQCSGCSTRTAGRRCRTPRRRSRGAAVGAEAAARAVLRPAVRDGRRTRALADAAGWAHDASLTERAAGLRRDVHDACVALTAAVAALRVASAACVDRARSVDRRRSVGKEAWDIDGGVRDAVAVERCSRVDRRRGGLRVRADIVVQVAPTTSEREGQRTNANDGGNGRRDASHRSP
jgi:hypothetical protein